MLEVLGWLIGFVILAFGSLMIMVDLQIRHRGGCRYLQAS